MIAGLKLKRTWAKPLLFWCIYVCRKYIILKDYLKGVQIPQSIYNKV